MSAAVGVVIEARGALSGRREQILDAAEASFVRNGFHRTTMQDLARAAGMTAGNIYHYFKSKEAVVLGLAERERQSGSALVGELEQSGDRHAALQRILEHYFLSVTRESAVLRLDIWSEATRNPAIAAMTEESEAAAREWFIETFAALATSPACDPVALYGLVGPLMKGILVNRALLPDNDPQTAVAQIRAMIDAGLDGHLPADFPRKKTP